MKYTFKELIDVPKLQELTDELYAVASIPSAIVTMDGEILIGSGWQKICTDFHRKHPQIEKECIKSDTNIRTKLADGEPFAIYKCPRGLVDASSPVIIAGEHVANVFSGQVFLEPPDETTKQFFREQARKFGFDETEYMKAFKEVPIFTEKKFRAGISFLTKLAQTIADNGLTRLRELEAMESVRESEERFRAAFDSAQDCVLIWDKEYNYLYANQAAIAHVGTTPDQVIGKNIRDGLGHVPEFMHLWMSRVDKVFQTGEKLRVQDEQEMEGRQYHTDSILTPIRDTVGNVISVCVVYRDVTELKLAEEALRESENNLKQAQKVSHVGSWDLDVVTGTLCWSDEAYRIYGFKPQEFAPTYEKFQAIIHPEDHERVQKAVDAALSSAADYDIDFRFMRLDGQTGWVHSDGQVTHDGEGKPIRFFGTQIDITERKQAEEALRVSEEKYRTLLENLPQKIFHKNKTLTYVSCNENYAQDLKINPDDIAGKTDYDFYPRDLAEKYRADDKEIIKSGKTEEIQEGYVLDGKDFIVQTMKTPVLDETGNVTGILGIFWDITEQQRNREALKESEEKFRTLFDTSPHAIALTEMKTGKLIDVNDKLCKISKYTRDELIDRTTTQLGFYSEDDRNRFVNELTNSGKVHDLEMEFEIKDGSIINTRMFATSMQIKGEVFILTEFYDITEQKGLEAKLQQTQKMEAIGTLAGGIAHEFNNTLLGIMGNIELLKMNFSKDEGIDKHLESMKSAGHRMSRLTDQLLAYAEGGKYQPKDLKLDDFVIETLPILQHDLSPTVRVETHFQKDIWYINADNAQMQMVLSAILANSNDAIEDEGLIRLTAENKDLDEDFTKQHSGLKPGLYVSLTIEDDGKGMDEETRSGIFEPFFTTKFQGRGMGMAAVYGIVRNHDGWISVDSELGRGTKVQIYLPAFEIKVEEPKKAKVEVATGSGTILMIEDEDVVIEVTQAMLEMLGYRVMVAKTGKDAIHIAETFDGQIDLALLDIKLPDIDGRNLYPLIMKARSNLKVIVFSGYSIDGPAREILDAGAQEFIQKPFSIATLSEKLKEVFEGK